jgi:light-regulated signal transduction histidine kinase (bacteriophytochrome)
MISDIWTELLGEIDAPDARIEIGDLPAVTTDAGVLRQVLRNIVANALVHRAAAAPVVTIAADARASGWTLYISDNGPGIEADVHESIFQPFWSLPREGAEKRIGLDWRQRAILLRLLAAACGSIIRTGAAAGSPSSSRSGDASDAVVVLPEIGDIVGHVFADDMLQRLDIDLVLAEPESTP